MKILHITTSVSKHSACNRINEALLQYNIDSKILALRGNGECGEEIVQVNKIKKKIVTLITHLENKIFEKKNNLIKSVFSTSITSVNITKNKLVQDADIIHLHWVNGGLVSIKDIYKLSKMGKKIIWTMHDSWGFTGGCHVRYECNKYEKGCNKCFLLNSKNKFDLSYFLWKYKEKYYNKSNFTVVLPSKKHKYFAEKSNLLKEKDLLVINNPINPKIYKKINKSIAREILNISKDKKIIVFGAINAKNKYKGYEYLIESLKEYKKLIKNIKDIEICIFGADSFKEIENIGYKVSCLGQINNQTIMNLVYAAGDIFISPSIEESFGQTFLESIMSGTMAIGFENTGAEDIIVHNKNGYLAKYKDIGDLTKGIIACLDNVKDINIDENKFNYENIGSKYIEIYEKMLKQ